MTVTVPEVPPLARIPGVELIHTGEWEISTGTFTATIDDIAGAVAALDCPAVRRPILKLGHVDPRFDGEPAVGWIDNLAAGEGGHTLLGDYVGMPGWLGEVLASAYPDRSIEAESDFRCQLGHLHPFVLTGVALLGVAPPGIGTLASLQDVAALYGVAAAAPERGTTVRLTVRASKGARMPSPRPPTIAAGVTTEDVRRKYYDDAPWSVWIEELQLDPLQLITIDDSTGKRSRVPITIGAGDGEDAVTFGEPVPVVIRYEDAPTADVAASGRRTPIRYATRAESRPGSSTTSAAAPAAAGTTHQEGGRPVAFSDEQLTTLRRDLGLADDADEATITAAVTEALAERADPPAGTTTVPPGTVLVDAARLETLEARAARGDQARTEQEQRDREQRVDAAIRDGRIAPARREHWLAQLAADAGAGDVLASLAPGLIPVGKPVGHNAAGAIDASATEPSIQRGRELYASRHGKTA